jgi:Cu+-exporting ATPase
MAELTQITLPIEGMTCASCVNRIERYLRRTDGVLEASVNLATERATVTIDPTRAGRGELVGAVEAAGYEVRPEPAEPAASPAAALTAEDVARDRDQRWLLVGAVASIAVAAALMAMMFWPQTVVPMETLNWLALVPATLVQFGAGWRFYGAAWRAARHRTTNMDTLVAVGTTAAWAYSVVVTLAPRLIHEAGLHPETYFDSAAAIVGLVLLGRWLEARAKGRAASAIRRLLGLQATSAHLVDGAAERDIPVEDVQPGDLLRVRTGETIPVDGVIVEGATAIDESMLTGESVPVDRAAGETVLGATRNTSGSVVIRATRVGRETALARIVALVERAQASKAPIQRLADRISEAFIPFVLAASAVTFLIWFVAGPEPRLTFALTTFIAVVIVACPCAMGLATPTAVMVGTGRGAEAGILFRSAEALEMAGRVSAVVFDKTGTLTVGRPAVERIVAAEGRTEREVLHLAASAERGSEHPLARAIVARANPDELGFGTVDGFRSRTGHGVEATVDGHAVLVGSASFLAAHGVTTNDAPAATALHDAAADAASQGRTVVRVAVEGHEAGLLLIADPVRPQARGAIAELASAGIDAWLVSGDQPATVAAVAVQLGIPAERVRGGVLPEDKATVIADLQGGGRVVAMVGDGINDAPALAAADLGVAIGSGSDVAVDAADVTLVGDDPRSVLRALVLSRRTTAVIRQNLFWAFAYNVLLIPVAAGVLFPAFGILLNPALAAGAMALSSVSVVTNSLRLRGVDVRPDVPLRGGTGRGGRWAALRDGAYLAAVGALAIGIAAGEILVDRAIDAGAQHVTLTASALRYSATTIEVRAGRDVVLDFTNDDAVFHDWHVDGLANVEAAARPGQTQRVRFRIDAPGSYSFDCTVDGHAAAGMAGLLVVDPA